MWIPFMIHLHKPENDSSGLWTIYHFGCEEGPHKSVEFALLRTGGITFRTEIPLSGKSIKQTVAAITRLIFSDIGVGSFRLSS